MNEFLEVNHILKTGLPIAQRHSLIGRRRLSELASETEQISTASAFEPRPGASPVSDPLTGPAKLIHANVNDPDPVFALERPRLARTAARR